MLKHNSELFSFLCCIKSFWAVFFNNYIHQPVVTSIIPFLSKIEQSITLFTIIFCILLAQTHISKALKYTSAIKYIVLIQLVNVFYRYLFILYECISLRLYVTDTCTLLKRCKIHVGLPHYKLMLFTCCEFTLILICN